MTDEKRNTTVHDRFQVSCSFCGFLSSYKSFHDAFEDAKLRKRKHNQIGERIEVFDVMAHEGAPELWDAATGKVISRRMEAKP